MTSSQPTAPRGDIAPENGPTSLGHLISGLIAAVVLAVGLAPAVQPTPVSAQGGPRVSVVAFPDVAGEGDFWPACSGCDGEFTAADALIASADPLPPFDVEIRNGGGSRQTATTSPLSQGRQAAGFIVPAVGDYTIEILTIPAGWSLCPSESDTVSITAADFDPADELARVTFGFTRGCAALPTETNTPPATVPATAGPSPTATPSVMPGTASPTRSFVTPTPDVPSATPVSPEPTDDGGSGGDPGDGDGGGGGSSTGDAPSATGAIRGLVFIDTDADGVLDPDEPGLAGVRVLLDGGGPQFSAQTSGAGNYEFAGLGAGAYNVSIDLPAGYSLSTTGRHEGVAVSGGTVLGIDFGLIAADSDVRPASGVSSLPSTGALGTSKAPLLLVLAALAAFLGVLGRRLERRRYADHS